MRTFALMAGGMLVLGACGGNDDDSEAVTPGGSSSAEESADGSAGGSELQVIAEDISFPEDSYQVAAGSVDVVYENDGSIEHTLLIEGVDGFKLTVPGNGDVDEGTVDLEPGEYTIYCDVPGHQSGGMEAELAVS